MKIDSSQPFIGAVVDLYMKTFHPYERVDVDEIRASLDGEVRRLTTIRDAGHPVGFALTIRLGPDWSLLEYLAVDAAMRSRGHGSTLLRSVLGAEKLAGVETMFIEIEHPTEPHLEDADAKNRQRRLRFYDRNRARPVPCELSYRPPSFNDGSATPLLLLSMGRPPSFVETAEALAAIGRTSYGSTSSSTPPL